MDSSKNVYDPARVSGDAQVYGDARVCDSAWVSGSARVCGYAEVSGDAQVSGRGDISDTRHYLTHGPIGSEDRTVTIHRHYDGPAATAWGHLVIAGCWTGTLDQLEARIDGHPWGDDPAAARHAADYRAFIAAARPRAAEWAAEPLTDDDHARWAVQEAAA